MAHPTLRSSPLRQSAMAARRRLFQWRFLAEVWGELRKSEWPTREEAFRLTGIVIAIAISVGILLGAIDLLFNTLGRVVLGT